VQVDQAAKLSGYAESINPSDKTENTLRDDANRIAGELADEKAAIVFGALLIADAISRGTGRITEATALRR
jgi:hypothetical protein